jgi:ABC-2 type transport system ATP-binding protein
MQSLRDLLRRGCGASRGLRALDNVSFRWRAGQIAAVVGLNGAGKTTLLKSLADLLMPTSGRVIVAGHVLSREGLAARALIGYVPSDERSFFWRLSGRENLEFFAGLYGMGPREARSRIADLLEQFGLTGKAGGHFCNYSSGMRKRLAIVRGLLHGPRILILDEPTNSLDIQWDRSLRRFVQSWVAADPRRLVVWSTHRLEEVHELCRTVLVLRQGRVAYDGDPAGLPDGLWSEPADVATDAAAEQEVEHG